MNILLRMFIAAVLLVLTVGTGIWMSSLDKTHQGKFYTFHKVIAVVTTVNMVFFILGLLRMGNVELPNVLLLLVGGLSGLALFASGAMLSNGKMPYAQMNTIHSLAAVMAIVSVGLFLFSMIWQSMGNPA